MSMYIEHYTTSWWCTPLLVLLIIDGLISCKLFYFVTFQISIKSSISFVLSFFLKYCMLVTSFPLFWSNYSDFILFVYFLFNIQFWCFSMSINCLYVDALYRILSQFLVISIKFPLAEARLFIREDYFASLWCNFPCSGDGPSMNSIF